VLAGLILSGPVGFLLVELTRPQPRWTSVAAFVAHYHVIQTIPYYFGFVLISGILMLTGAHYVTACKNNYPVTMQCLLAVLCATVFAALIAFNYLCQVIFVHHLVQRYPSGQDELIAAFSMANPLSLSWAIEIVGYGILGVATWLLAGYYRNLNKHIYFLLISNGIVSVATVVLVVIDLNWLSKPIGLVAYLCWNLLMIVLMVLIYRFSKNNSHEAKRRG
jgi:hypothetical protein